MFIVLLCTGCSTKRNTPATRAWHELTTRYNIYFNAEEAYNEALKSITESHIDNYQTWLPMYPNSADPNDTVVKQPGGPFDRVVEKMTTAIQEHSITAKPRRDPAQPNTQEYRDWLRQNEFNPFIDRAWLLMGKAHVQNKDYTEAISVLSYTVRLFAYDIDVVSEAQIWMMRAYTEMGWFSDAEGLALTLQVRRLPKDLHDKFTEFYAFLLIRQEKYRDALPFLIQTVKSEKSGIQKRRLQFLLGQVYAHLGERENAYNAFEQIKKLSTPYDEVFNALVAQSQVATGDGEIIGELQKMAENKKNSTYLDRIYAAIGDVYLSRNNVEKAIENYLLAEEKSVRNGVEKALTQVALGDIYFERKDFLKAEPRYSQALGALPRSSGNYARVEFRTDVLGELVPHMEVLARQDSLRQLAVQPDESDKIIEGELFRIGSIAKDRLGDFEFAVEVYNRHLTDFPESIRRKEVYHQLYQLYLRMGNRAMAKSLKDKIISEFPQSEYAAAMSDPDYEHVVRNYARVQDSLYQQTYLAYRQGQVETVQGNFKRAQKLFFNGHLMPKFMLLNALSLAQSGNPEQLNTALSELIQKHPGTEETKMAQQILAGLSEGKTLVANVQPFSGIDWESHIVAGNAADSVCFEKEKNLPHSLLLLFSPNSLRKNELLFAVSDFNFSNFQIRSFHTDYTYVSPYEALQIKPFRSFEEAGRYASMLAGDSIFRQNITTGIVPLVISDKNLEILRDGEPLENYISFVTNELSDGLSDSIPLIVSVKIPQTITETEKNVPLEPEKTGKPDIASKKPTPKQSERLTDEQRLEELERKAEEALRQTGDVFSKRDRERILKEREEARKEWIKQRERDLKQREKVRKEILKQRERERKQKLKEQERLRKEKLKERERIVQQRNEK